jgi:hypothetical protein
LKKAPQKLLLCWGMGDSGITPMAQINKTLFASRRAFPARAISYQNESDGIPKAAVI